MSDPRIQLPSVTALLGDSDVQAAVDREGHDRVVEALRLALGRARQALTSGRIVTGASVIADALLDLGEGRRARLRAVINATGVILHTNLGRAPLSDATIAAIVSAARATNLEFDLLSGERGRRGGLGPALLASLCGAEAAMTVNNGAAALTLVMAALATARQVVVSRGELVEIGGSFRLPEILSAAGVQLVEVGTTNRTHPADYRAAVHEGTGAILRVHPSNYRVVGFATRPSADDIADIAHHAGVPFVHDIGSGLLHASPNPAVAGEPTAADALQAGADLVVFSGDKLLGGPQVGAVVGRRELVEKCRRHPLARALRVDKLRLAALESTLDAHSRGRLDLLPVWSFLEADSQTLRERAECIAGKVDAEAVATEAVIGGGSVPGATLSSWGIRLAGDPDRLAMQLRAGDPPVIGRIVDGDFIVDLRAVPRDDDKLIVTAIAGLSRESS